MQETEFLELSKTSKLLVIGVCSTDIVGQANSFPLVNSQVCLSSLTITTGGNALNIAIDASKIGMKPSLVGCVGADYQGDFLLSKMAQHDIDINGIQRCDYNTTGSCIIMRNDKNESMFFTHRGANAKLDLNKIPKTIIERAEFVIIAGLFLLTCAEKQMSSFLRELKKQKKTIVVDTSPNIKNLTHDYIEETCRSVAPYIDYFVPSETESNIISGENEINETFQILHSKGFRNVIIKRAEKGSVISLNYGDEKHSVPSVKTNTVVDSVGAGDAYVTGFSYGLINGYPIREAALFGSILGSQCVQAIGATQGINKHSLDLFQKVTV